MLHEFVTTYRDAIIAKSRAKLTARPWPTASSTELENGVPLFLTQLSETLRQEATGAPYSPTAIGSTATRHGRDLLTLGFTVSQVVHDYGDICQAVNGTRARAECTDHDGRIPHVESVSRHGDR